MKETLDDRRKLGRIKGLKNQRELCTFEADTGKSKGTLEDEGRLQKILEDLRGLWKIKGTYGRVCHRMYQPLKGRTTDMKVRYSIDYDLIKILSTQRKMSS